MTKIEFVRQQPYDLSIHEVIRRAKEAGITLSSATVYAARRSPPATGAATAATFKRLQARAMPEGQLECEFVTTAAELGLLRAKELLDELRRVPLS
jgi:hypothetical protein